MTTRVGLIITALAGALATGCTTAEPRGDWDGFFSCSSGRSDDCPEQAPHCIEERCRSTETPPGTDGATPPPVSGTDAGGTDSGPSPDGDAGLPASDSGPPLSDCGDPRCFVSPACPCEGGVCSLGDDGATECRRPGPSGELGACRGPNADCGEALVCLDPDMNGAGLCHRTCAESADCSPGRCVFSIGRSDVGFCEDVCSVSEQDCSVGICDDYGFTLCDR